MPNKRPHRVRRAALPSNDVAGTAAVLANPNAFGVGAPSADADASIGEEDGSIGDDISQADASALLNLQTAAIGDSPLATFLREHMAAHNGTIDQAVEAWRLSKPSARTYKTAFRCIVRFWCAKGGVEWDTSWNEDAADTWTALCETVKELIEEYVS